MPVQAYWEAEEQAEEKARMKRQDRVIKQWSRLVQGLRLRKRLQEQYGADAERQGVGTVDEDKYGPPEVNYALPNPAGLLADSQMPEVVHDKQGGGFLLVADDVVEPHHLPRYQHVIPPPPSTSHAEPVKCGDEQVAFEDVMDFPLETMDDDQDQDIEDVPSSHQPLQTNGVPKTMQQMAEDAIRHQLRNSSRGPPVDGEYQLAAKTVIPQTRTTRSSRTAIRSNSISGKVVPRPRPDRKRLRDEGSGPVSDSEGSRSLPVKRARNPTTTPAPTGRLLRPRPPKNAAKIQEEIEQEVAFRRAVADF